MVINHFNNYLSDCSTAKELNKQGRKPLLPLIITATQPMVKRIPLILLVAVNVVSAVVNDTKPINIIAAVLASIVLVWDIIEGRHHNE